ncbi:MAG: ribbon-helix-helix domain-containing protein [Euryarchaeota archaeon]|nr:ribbon-helix-helix domain-containing protein [Euryarchaeota archaeon]
MAAKTMILNVRITEKQYDELENLIERGEYTSKAEFIREILREKFDEFSLYLHKKAEKDRKSHIPLEKYGRSRGLE